jgi:hypothetical protein
MGNNIRAIAKFSEIIYLIDLLENGVLFFNTIKYFSEREKEEAYRFDSFEGCDLIYQTNYLKGINIDGIYLPFMESADPTRIRLSNKQHFTHVCCFSVIYDEPIIQNGSMKVFDERMLELGNGLVVSVKIKSFVQRIKDAIKNDKKIISSSIGLVEYIDEKTYSGELGAFRKVNRYSFQNELRIALEINSSDSYKIKLGNIQELFTRPIERSNIVNKVVGNKSIIS